MKFHPFLLLAPAALALLAAGTGCTFPTHGTVYDRAHVGQAMSIETGDILAINNVTVSGEAGPIGITGGGLVGHAAAGGIGQGVGSDIAAAGGAVAGAITGSAVEEAATRKSAQEMTIKTSGGDTIVVVQIPKDSPFAVGEHVQILQGGSGATIKHLY